MNQPIQLINTMLLGTLILGVSACGHLPTKPQADSPNLIKTISKAPECTDVIKACDQALADKDKILAADDAIITRLSQNNIELNKQVDKKQESLKSPLRNPGLMVGAGGALGMAVGGPIVMGAGLLVGILLQWVF